MSIQDAIRIAAEFCRLADSGEGLGEYAKDLTSLPSNVQSRLADALMDEAGDTFAWVVARYARVKCDSGLGTDLDKQLLAKADADAFAREYWTSGEWDPPPYAADLMLSLLSDPGQTPFIAALWRRAPFSEMARICQGLGAAATNTFLYPIYANYAGREDDDEALARHCHLLIKTFRDAGIPMDALCSNLHEALTTNESEDVEMFLSVLWGMTTNADRQCILRSLSDLIEHPERHVHDDEMLPDRIEWLTNLRDHRSAMLEASVHARMGITMSAP